MQRAGDSAVVPRLLEREDELAVLFGALASARRGTGKLVLITGSAGLDKTELLSAVVRAAHADGVEVLTATSVELERELPFGVALQLFERRVAAADGEEREALF